MQSYRRCRSIIHSGHFYSAPYKSSTTQRRSRLQHGYCIGVSRRCAHAIVGKGLAQGPYMAARAGVEPTTLRYKRLVQRTTHNLHVLIRQIMAKGSLYNSGQLI